MARLKDNRNVDPARFVGRWAMVHNHFLFKVESYREPEYRVVEYTGTGLHGQRIVTRYPIQILRAEDEEWLNAQVEAES